MKARSGIVLVGVAVVVSIGAAAPIVNVRAASGCSVTRLDAIAFPDAGYGVSVGVDSCNAGVVLTTSNGGASWFRQAIPAGIGDLQAVSSPDRCHVWAIGWSSVVGGPIIVRTSDCGVTWTTQLVPYADFLDSISFVDPWHGWIGGGYYGAGNSVIYQTSDGGNTWTNETGAGASTATRGVFGIKFATTLQGWAVAADESGPLAAVIATVDGGLTWTRQAISPFQQYGRAVYARPDALHAWVVGYGGNSINGQLGEGIWRTVSGGNPWIPSPVQSDNSSFSGVSFSDNNNGWVVGGTWPSGYTGPYYAVILRSVDGGANWVRQAAPTGLSGLSGVAAVSSSRGCASGGTGTQGVVVCTSDGGATWSRTF